MNGQASAIREKCYCLGWNKAQDGFSEIQHELNHEAGSGIDRQDGEGTLGRAGQSDTKTGWQKEQLLYPCCSTLRTKWLVGEKVRKATAQVYHCEGFRVKSRIYVILDGTEIINPSTTSSDVHGDNWQQPARKNKEGTKVRGSMRTWLSKFGNRKENTH